MTRKFDEPPFWGIFGVYPDGCVDVSDGDRDVLVHVPREEAERQIAAVNAVWDAWLWAGVFRDRSVAWFRRPLTGRNGDT